MFTIKSLAIGMGLLMVIIYLPFVFNFRVWEKELLELLSDRKLVRINGLILLLLAFFLLNTYYRLDKTWAMTISILGWLLLLKGLVWFWFPRFVDKMAGTIARKNEWLLVIGGVIGIGIGVFFEYIGFYIL